MRIAILAAILTPALAVAHTRSSDPVAMSAPPAVAITCSGQDITADANAVLLAGGRVTLSSGTCLASTIQIGDGASLTGAGKQSDGGAYTLLQATAPDGNVIEVGDGRRVRYASISGLTVDGAATAGRASDGQALGEGIHIRADAGGVTISDVEVRDNSSTGIVIAGQGNTVTGSDIHDNWHDGVFLQGEGGTQLVSGNVISANSVHDNSRQRPEDWHTITPGNVSWDEINLGDHAADNLIQGNAVLHGDIRANARSAPMSGNQAIGNTVTDSLDGGIAFGIGEVAATISGNTVTNCQPHSIALGATSSGTATGNTVVGGGRMPFVVAGHAVSTLDANATQ